MNNEMKLRKALEFYADLESWRISGTKGSFKFIEIVNDLGVGEFTIGDETDENIGGKLAREVLKELYGDKNEI